VAFVPGGKLLASGDGAGQIFLWDLTAKKRAAILEHKDTGPIYGLAAGSDGKTLAAGCGLSMVMLWDLATKQPRSILEGPAGRRAAPVASTGR
jgi:WD40 repeat protein